MLPSLLTAAGLMADHCDDHGHHVHLCLVHAGETPVWLTALGAVALATFVIRALRLGAASLRRRRSMNALERLGTIDTRSRFPVVRVPGAPRLCLATGLFRRRVVYSASLAEHLPPAELAAALAHEAAHLRRRDTLSLGLLTLAGLFTFPAAAARFRALFLSAAEEACDAEAAGEHGAETVARALVAAARLRLTVANGLGFTGNTLAARVAALLDAAAIRPRPPVRSPSRSSCSRRAAPPSVCSASTSTTRSRPPSASRTETARAGPTRFTRTPKEWPPMRWLSPVRRACVWLATIVGSFTVASAQPVPLTREAFVAQVLRTGLAARALDAQVAVAGAAREAAGQWLNPTLAWERSAAVTGRRADESQDEFALRVPLVLSGRLGLEREAAAASAESAGLHGDWAREALGRDARLAFDAVLAARARAAVLEEAAAAVEALGQVVAAREKAGESAGYERLRMELEAALVADLHTAAVLERTRAESAAGAMLGSPDGVLPALAGDDWAETPQTLPSGPPIAERCGREGALQSGSGRRDRPRGRPRRRGVPDPVVTAGAQLLDAADSGRGAAYVVGVEVPLPFFDSGEPAAEVERARARAAEAARLETVRQAERMQALARDTLDAKRARLATHRTTVLARAERLRELALGAWKAGGADTLTLLDAQRAARDARLAALDLALDARNAETDLVYTLGHSDRWAPALLRREPKNDTTIHRMDVGPRGRAGAGRLRNTLARRSGPR